MNTFKSTAGWHIWHGRLRQQCARIAANDHLYAEGREEELIGRLQRSMKLSEEKIWHLLQRNHGHWKHD
ncbi:MAG: general stress protein CsbD [Prosthecobacter sp.]|jgi:hypothetical protein|uniref:hypothetical protein n=1 Tax=Prosthecobacter sp. TaxID=1965333 RepID=UPI0019FCF2F6|nr:hypothetical protein [Prosthecobacter sp.]MBE2286781.1 general stress protein CsbD [Prosthecobacter sp.]